MTAVIRPSDLAKSSILSTSRFHGAKNRKARRTAAGIVHFSKPDGVRPRAARGGSYGGSDSTEPEISYKGVVYHIRVEEPGKSEIRTTCKAGAYRRRKHRTRRWTNQR